MSTPRDLLREGARLFDGGHPWHAHEVWETAWRADRSPHRDAWKGLIQLAAAVHHLRRGNPGPVPVLLARAKTHWQAHGQHLAAHPAAVTAALARVEQTGVVPMLAPLL